MAQELQTKFSFDPSDSVEKVGSVRSEIRALKEALLSIPKDDPQWPALFEKYSRLQGEVRELNKLSRALDPNLRVEGYMKIGEAGVGAFTAMKGAANLFGVSNENVLKNLEQVESAMAVLRGLKAFDEGLKTARAMYQVLKLNLTGVKQNIAGTKALGQAQAESAEGTKVATTATRGFGLALKAIGIGLITMAIAYLIDNWKELKKQFTGLLPDVGNLSGSFDKFKQVLVGVGSVVVNIVLTPIKLFIQEVKTAIQVFQDVKNGNFGKIFSDIGEGVKQSILIVKEGLDVVKHFQEGEAASAAAQQEERDKKALKQTIKNQEDRIAVLKAAGKETYELELTLSHNKQKLYKDDVEKLHDALQEERVLRAEHSHKLEEEAAAAAKKAMEAEKKLQEEEERVALEHQRRQEKIAEDEKEQRKKEAEELLKDQSEFILKGQQINEDSDRKKLDELNKTFAALKEKSKGDFKALFDLDLSYQKQKAAIDKDIQEKAAKEFEKSSKAYVKSLEDSEKLIVNNKKLSANQQIASIKQVEQALKNALASGKISQADFDVAYEESQKAEDRINKEKQKSFKDSVSAIGGALNALSGIVSKNAAAGKAIAAGQALINSFQGFTLALANAPGPVGIIEGAAVLAAGLVNVEKILSTKVGPADTQGGSMPGTGGASLQFNAPSVPQTTQTTNLSPSSIAGISSAQSQQPIQTVVSESDITNTQTRVSQYSAAGTLGQ